MSDPIKPEGYDVAQVCPNRHVATAQYTLRLDQRATFCQLCGEKTITACAYCSSPIRGRDDWDSSDHQYDPPKFCHNCGKPLPWTERALKASKELAAETMPDTDLGTLNQSIEQLMGDTRFAQVAVVRYQKIMKKATPHVAEAFKNILYGLVTEGIKKQLWG